jgi:hypothetical protein
MAEARNTFPCKGPTVLKVAFEMVPDREPWERQIGET